MRDKEQKINMSLKKHKQNNLINLSPIVVGFLATMCISSTVSAVVVTAGANTETITQVVVNIDNDAVNTTFNASQTAATNAIGTAALQSISLSDGTTLNQFDRYQATVSNFNADLAGVIETLNSSSTPPTSQFSNTDPNTDFLNELAEVHSNGDIANYIRVDGASSNVSWSVQFDDTVGFDLSDRLVVQERDGNTNFTLTALDLNGNVIAGADVLEFNGGSYQFDSGISNTNDPFSGQSQVLSVIDLSLFNTTEAVGGFTIDNTGNADIKVFIGTIPEPSSTLLAGLGMLTLTFRRRR